jgi:hypothetical protein
MSANHTAYGPQGSSASVPPLAGVTPQAKRRARETESRSGRGGPEGRYLAGPGKPVYRRLIDMLARLRAALAGDQESQRRLDRAERADDERKQNHRGGDRTWLLRLFIIVAIVAEAGTAYVAMEALVASVPLAILLAALTAAVGTGLACLLANRRLNHLPVPRAARVLEAIFVIVLTVLRFESLQIQATGLAIAADGAALAAIISALALLGIEEIVVETCTFAMFCSRVRVSWKRWRRDAAASRLASIRAAIDAAAQKLEQHFLEFLLKSEGLPLDGAQQHAAALRAAFTVREV